MMDFIRDLEEARLTRDAANRPKFTYTDVAERAYLSFLALEVLRRYPAYQKNVKKYAEQTLRGTYKQFLQGASDLHNFIYFLTDDVGVLKLKEPEAASAMKARSNFPLNLTNGYLHKLKAGQFPAQANQVMMKIEDGLRISDPHYRAIRRGLPKYDSLPGSEKKKLVTKLLYAMRAKLRSSDIIDDLEKLAAQKNLEVGGVIDTEFSVSIPDITTTGADLSNYRFLVGTKNIAMVKRFLDFVRRGDSIPRDVLKAYLPAIQMIDNIVKGGPAYIQQLKLLEKRAKNRK
jgi:hypothetical protein|tara:strand:+ start:6589 stop:7452 length:864 start_codon:yes stop_codon:yes gene_type:complete